MMHRMRGGKHGNEPTIVQFVWCLLRGRTGDLMLNAQLLRCQLLFPVFIFKTDPIQKISVPWILDSCSYWTLKLTTFSGASKPNNLIIPWWNPTGSVYREPFGLQYGGKAHPRRSKMAESVGAAAPQISGADRLTNMESHGICTCDWCCLNICISNVSLSHFRQCTEHLLPRAADSRR